jgi:hypothetical protein
MLDDHGYASSASSDSYTVSSWSEEDEEEVVYTCPSGTYYKDGLCVKSKKTLSLWNGETGEILGIHFAYIIIAIFAIIGVIAIIVNARKK